MRFIKKYFKILTKMVVTKGGQFHTKRGELFLANSKWAPNKGFPVFNISKLKFKKRLLIELWSFYDNLFRLQI